MCNVVLLLLLNLKAQQLMSVSQFGGNEHERCDPMDIGYQ